MKATSIVCRLLALLILVIMLMNYNSGVIAIQTGITWLRDGWWHAYLLMSGVLFFGLNTTAAIGLWLQRSWGFICTYLAIVVSTIMFAVAYAPFATTLLPMPAGYAYISLLIVNFAVLVLTAYLHYSVSKTSAKV